MRKARSSRAGTRQQRRRVYRRRRLIAMVLGLALLVGLYYGLDWVLTRLTATA